MKEPTVTATPNMPQPKQTPRGPAYEGRLLPRPEDEVVDQGLAFDVRTFLNRRRMFAVFGMGAGALALAACSTDGGSQTASAAAAAAGSSGATPSSSAVSASGSNSGLTEIPDETNGPYPADGTNGPDILETSGVVRKDIRSSFGTSITTAAGIPLEFTFTILDMVNGGVPFADVAVYAWHCDRAGLYSMYSAGVTGENYLRGVQITGSDGKVTFTSIFPACYSGRWPHIHFEVYPNEASIADQGKAISTSQMAFPKDVLDIVYATSGYERSVTNLSQLTLATDNVFGDDGGVHQMGVLTGDVTKGYVAALTVPIDTSTTPTGGNGPVGSNGGPGGGTPPTGGPGVGGPPSGG
jgi:protocatechuate 3,4-dioxygenase beta subunit